MGDSIRRMLAISQVEYKNTENETRIHDSLATILETLYIYTMCPATIARTRNELRSLLLQKKKHKAARSLFDKVCEKQIDWVN